MSIRRTVKLLLDKAAARKVERDLKAQSRRIKSDQKRTWQEIGRFVAAAFGARAIARFTKEMFKLGSAASETGSKFRTVFGTEAAAELDVFIEKFGALAGLTKTEGRDMLAIAGTIGQGVGFAGPAVAAFAGEIVELAADLQSFHDVPIAETFAAIRSGVTGEAEQLKKFGIILRAVDVDQRALLATGKERASELTETERVTARLALITEKAGVAVGDLARTQDSTANTGRRLSTVWRQLKEDIAGGLLPVFSLLINAWGQISGGAQGAADVIGIFSAKLVEFVGGIQIIAVELNAFFRSIPAWINLAAAKLNDFFINGLIRPAEFAINKLRELFGKDPIDITSGMVEANERFRQTAKGEIQAWRALIEEETAAILKAAEVVDEARAILAPSESGAGPAEVVDEEAAARRLQRLIDAKLDEQLHERRLADAERQAEANAKAKEEFEAAQADLQAKATRTAEAMTGAFETFFRASASGFQGAAGVWGAAAEAARGAGGAIVEAFTAGQAEKEMAMGAAAIASGIWPPNPAAIASGLQHFAAAALFRAIPGAVAGGGSRGGGGFGGPALPRGAIGGSAPSAQPIQTEVNIFIDPLSPMDTEFQRVVLGATQNAQERFGDNVKVNIRPRTGGRS